MVQLIRVLHVLGGMNRGGAETMVMNLYRNIDHTKIQFDFVVHTKDKCDYNDEIKSLGGRIYSIPPYTGNNHLHYKEAWNKFFKEHSEYRIIHGHVRSTAAIYLKIARKYNLITIAHSHNTSSGEGFTAIVKNILQYKIKYTADYFFACSEVAGKWLFGKKACNRENYFIINNAIETKDFIYNDNKRLDNRKKMRINDKFVIGHVGRFHIQKNHEFLIDVFKLIHDKNSNAVLILVGDGKNRQSIEKKVNYLRLNDSVIFTGVRPDIPALLQTMDVFVFPSLHEGLPVTLVEAQASGLPCIISDRITDEVKVTDLVKCLSLSKSAEYWSEEVLKYSQNFERTNTYTEIVESGYDIEAVSKWYMEFCISQYKE